MKRFFWLLQVGLFIVLQGGGNLSVLGVEGKDTSSERPTLRLEVDGVIGPATLDFVQRGLSSCKSVNCASIALEINTPGGSLQTTRLLVEEILASPVPFLCFVSPQGARAGSAGAIIMLACHVSGALKTTNIGAATPVSGGGAEIPEDLRNKLVEDTKSWVKSLAELRGRSEDFAERIITEALALSASDALEAGAIEFVGESLDDFLEFSKGRTVEISDSREIEVEVGALINFAPDLRYHVLDQLTDPQVAYLLFMGSLGLLYFELTNPGAIIPGAVGAVGLVISLVSLHKLDVWWGGLLLMLLGMGFLAAEAFTPSFGFLGSAGFVSFLLGSIFLYNPMETGYVLPLGFLAPVLVVFLLVIGGLTYLALGTRKIKTRDGFANFIGVKGEVVNMDSPSRRSGQGRVLGEIWKIQSDSDLEVGQSFTITEVNGLVLKVKADV